MNICYWIKGFKMAGINLKIGEPVQIMMGFAYKNLLQTIPAQAKATDSLAVLLEDSAYFYSPYKTVKQKTSMALMKSFKILAKSCPSPNQLDKPTNTPGMPNYLVEYSCGVYEDVAPYTTSPSPLKVHYNPYEVAFATVKSLERDLTVLPWFNVLAVSEKYKIHHDGFEALNGEFKRSEYLSSVMSRDTKIQWLGAWPFMIPAQAYDVDVRDENGRLTGQMQRKPGSALGPDYHMYMVSPRYPLTGGWNYSFELTYKLPLSSVLKVAQEDQNVRELSVPLFLSHFDIAIEDFTLRFNLPEDAQVEQYFYNAIDPERVFDRLNTYKTYLSTKGEVSLELNIENLNKEHAKTIKLVYTYPWWGILRKPLALLFGLIFAVLCFRFGTSFDLSLAGKSKVQPNVNKKNLLSLFKLRREILANLDDVILQIDKPEGKSKREKLSKELATCTVSIFKELRTILDVDSTVSIYGATLKKLYEEHKSCVDMILDNVTNGAEKKIKSGSINLGKLEKDALELDQAILNWEAKMFAKSE